MAVADSGRIKKGSMKRYLPLLLFAFLGRVDAFVSWGILCDERIGLFSAFTEQILIPTWTPRSRFWKDSEEMAALPVLDLKEKFGANKPSPSTSNEPTVRKLHRNSKGAVVAVEVSTALSSEEGNQIQALADAVRSSSIGKSQFEHRSFGPGKGGNDCTYLAPLLQLVQAQTAAKVVSIAQLAWLEAEWGDALPSPMELGIRTSEHLCYDGWKSLEPHKDVGSIYTCNIALKDPSTYDGGEFFFHTSFFEQENIKLPRLSAIVFLSDTTHGVRAIVEGSRESFVTEFWDEEDAPLGMNRPTPETWETFLEKQKK
jgi:hypothetical protein